MDKKIKPYRGLPNKAPGPKFQCGTKLYIASFVLGFDFLSTGKRLISSSIYGPGMGV